MATLVERIEECERRLDEVEATCGIERRKLQPARSIPETVMAQKTEQVVAAVTEAVVPKSEPGSVLACCPDNTEHQVVRLIPGPGAPTNVVGEGQISVKSVKTGEYVPIYCCPFCNKRGK